MRRSALLAVMLLFSPVIANASKPKALACGDDASAALLGSQCATVDVPLRHADPSGEHIALFLRRIPASAEVPRRGEVWLLSGGPGESGASLYPLIATYQRAFPGFDLVIPDHRGTGRSSRICPIQEAPESPDGTGLAGSEWGPCIGSMYANLQRTSAFSITEAAQDLGTGMSQADRSGQVLLYGVSYGTQLALRLLQVNDLHVDGLILDGRVPPETTETWDLSRRTALVDQVGWRSMDEHSLQQYRALLAVEDAAWQTDVPGGDLRRFFAALLSFPALRDRLPKIVQDLSEGDTRTLAATVKDWNAALAQLGQGGNNQPALPPGLLVSGSVPRYPRDAGFGKTPDTMPRTLILQGTLDPNIAYAGAQEHAAVLRMVGACHVPHGGPRRPSAAVGDARLLCCRCRRLHRGRRGDRALCRVLVGLRAPPGPDLHHEVLTEREDAGSSRDFSFTVRSTEFSGHRSSLQIPSRRDASMAIKTAEDLFIHELSDIYSAEKQLTKALPRLARAADNPALATAFETHLEETQGQIERIDQVVEVLGIRLKRIKCAAMEGLVEEGKEVIDAIDKGPVRDAELIGGAQKVEHYEIASYGTIAALAKQLGYKDALPLLLETLEEEKATDEKLTLLAKSGGNAKAAQAA